MGHTNWCGPILCRLVQHIFHEATVAGDGIIHQNMSNSLHAVDS